MQVYQPPDVWEPQAAANKRERLMQRNERAMLAKVRRSTGGVKVGWLGLGLDLGLAVQQLPSPTAVWHPPALALAWLKLSCGGSWLRGCSCMGKNPPVRSWPQPRSSACSCMDRLPRVLQPLLLLLMPAPAPLTARRRKWSWLMGQTATAGPTPCP